MRRASSAAFVAVRSGSGGGSLLDVGSRVEGSKGCVDLFSDAMVLSCVL